MSGVRPIATFRRWKARSPARRILFWPVAITLFCGVIELAMPVDRLLENVRDMIRSHPADGAIVVVKVDDRSLKALPWPTRRAVDAEVAESLFALGARRVVFDRAFADPSPVGDDGILVRSLERHRGRLIVGARFEQDRVTGKRTFLMPIAPIRAVAPIGSYNVRRDTFGYTTGVPFASELDGRRYPSFAAMLAGKTGGVDELFEPDFSIEYRTIPSVSMVDVVNRAPGASIVAGKDVIIGPTAETLGDTHMIPRQGPIPGVYIHAIAAETLRRATPLNLGWWPLYAVTLALSLAYVRSQQRNTRLAVAAAAMATLVTVPVILDGFNVETDIVPALILLSSAIVRRRAFARKSAHPVTGLRTLTSGENETSMWPATMIGLKLRNYPNLRASLSDEEDRAVLTEIIRRLEVTGQVAELMHVDETFVWQTQLPVSQHLFDHIEGLFAIMSAPIDVKSRRVDLSFAFGIDNERDRPLSNRVGNVQLAADQAAAAGGKWRVHDPRVALGSDFHLSLPSEIEAAIAAGEIWVAYQAKLDLRRNEVCGAEALIRWSHPERGPIRPDEFIPVVEQANRIDRLTYFVLETAMRDARRLEAIAPNFTVAVNLSVRLLDDPCFGERVIALLHTHGLPAARLTLEITESFQLDADGDALRTLHQLRAAGVRLSIDDYGTKFSTLEYVRQLPATEIKIDQQFIRNLHTSSQDAIMVGHTIQLAHDLGLQVVAEGVEWPAAMVKLHELGCDVVQGYLIARPDPIDVLERFIRNIAQARRLSEVA